MVSEELQSQYLSGTGKVIGRFELFQTQLTTLRQFASHGIISKTPFGKFATQKPDAVVIERIPAHRVIAMADDKAPGGVTSSNWYTLAADLLQTKLKPTNALLGYVTDGANTRWIAGHAATVTELTREDGRDLPSKIDFNDDAFIAELEFIAANLNPVSGVIRSPKNLNPEALAREVWQTVWRLQADKPEDCLGRVCKQRTCGAGQAGRSRLRLQQRFSALSGIDAKAGSGASNRGRWKVRPRAYAAMVSIPGEDGTLPPGNSEAV